MTKYISTEIDEGIFSHRGDYVSAQYKACWCSECGESFNMRKTVAASNKFVVHVKCLDTYERRLKEQKRQAENEANEKRMAEQRARFEANKARRGEDMAKFALDWDMRQMEGTDTKEWDFFKDATRSLKRAQSELAEWTEKLAKDPSYALDWGMTAFKAAADIKVLSMVAYYFSMGLDVSDIRTEFDKEVYRGASFPCRSTSPTSNLMEQEIVAAYARAIRKGW